MNLSLFFPAYNEEKNIPKLVRDAKQLCKEVAEKYEIILVVFEGSTDKTLEVSRRFAKRDQHIRIVVQKKKDKGVGKAYHIGLMAAKYDTIMFSDADNQFDLQDFKKLLKYYPEYDIVTGYRKKRADPLPRILQAFAYNLLLNVFFRIGVRDSDCALKVFKKEVIKRIELSSITGMLVPELMIKAKRLGYRIKEVPVSHHKRMQSVSIFASGGFVKFKVVIRQLSEMRRVGKDIRKGRFDRWRNSKHKKKT